jgi:hypothetical protein
MKNAKKINVIAFSFKKLKEERPKAMFLNLFILT